MVTKIKQWCILLTLCTIGFCAFLVLCGEDAPGNTSMSWSLFFFWSKLTAGAILYLCYLTGRYCESQGLLPHFKNHENEWED